jgi:hypothetical protein
MREKAGASLHSLKLSHTVIVFDQLFFLDFYCISCFLESTHNSYEIGETMSSSSSSRGSILCFLCQRINLQYGMTHHDQIQLGKWASKGCPGCFVIYQRLKELGTLSDIIFSLKNGARLTRSGDIEFSQHLNQISYRYYGSSSVQFEVFRKRGMAFALESVVILK